MGEKQKPPLFLRSSRVFLYRVLITESSRLSDNPAFKKLGNEQSGKVRGVEKMPSSEGQAFSLFTVSRKNPRWFWYSLDTGLGKNDC